MPIFAGLFEVDPFSGDTVETLRIRYCDLCGDSPVYAGLPPWALIYYDPGECLYVCEGCVDSYLNEM